MPQALLVQGVNFMTNLVRGKFLSMSSDLLMLTEQYFYNCVGNQINLNIK